MNKNWIIQLKDNSGTVKRELKDKDRDQVLKFLSNMKLSQERVSIFNINNQIVWLPETFKSIFGKK